MFEYGFEDGKDYSLVTQKRLTNNPKNPFTVETDYVLTLDTSKEIAMIQRTAKGKEARQYFIEYERKSQSGALLSSEQVIQVVKMVKVFAVYEYRQQAFKQNQQTFVKDLLNANPKQDPKYIYAKFNAWRNDVLGAGKEVLEQRVKEYCVINGKNLYKAKPTNDEMLCFLGEYEQIKNAVWDLLTSQKKSKELAENIASLAQELAKEMKPFIERINESNLFFQKIDNQQVQEVFYLS
jgi:phage anti-repressor protein